MARGTGSPPGGVIEPKPDHWLLAPTGARLAAQVVASFLDVGGGGHGRQDPDGITHPRGGRRRRVSQVDGVHGVQVVLDDDGGLVRLLDGDGLDQALAVPLVVLAHGEAQLRPGGHLETGPVGPVAHLARRGLGRLDDRRGRHGDGHEGHDGQHDKETLHG